MDSSAELALAFINTTDRHVFLTGAAGSGKTTFLKILRNNTTKKMAIAAPTGIAAINAGGVTLHSLFQLPTTVFLPGESKSRINLTSAKRLILRELELLVIDEVSMLRADILDAIDAILRDVRMQPNLAFGGIQIVYIGDLHQLSPVATGEDLQQLEKYYSSLYFISAKVFALSNPVCVCLERIYRQEDPAFISVLNRIREGKATKQDIVLLNGHYREASAAIDGYITLVTHNKSADAINAEQLSKMEGEIVRIEAVITGEFDVSMYPTEKVLQLKEGARVMLLRNDRGDSQKYFNGKMGVINKIHNEKLTIDFGQGERFDIQKERWQNIRYDLDQKTGAIQQFEIGSYTQFPVRLAWAITIHKSQGLSFDRVVLDIQKVFAPGQAYVAFSRVRALEGLILKEPVNLEVINSNASSPNFILPPAEGLTHILQVEKIFFLVKTINQKLDWQVVNRFIVELNPTMVNQEVGSLVRSKINWYQTTSEKFVNEIKGMIEAGGKDLYAILSNRVQAACQYFLNDLDKLFEKILAPAAKKSKASVTQRLQHKFVKELITLIRMKKRDIETLMFFLSGAVVSAPVKKRGVVREGSTDLTIIAPKLVLTLFNKGVTIDEIAGQLNLSVPTVENYLAAFVTSGELHIENLISQEILEKVIPSPGISALTLKEQLGDALTFGQIKALLNHLKL